MSQHGQRPKVEIGTIAIDPEITLRRMVIRPTEPKGTVLLLHGFPETLYAWKEIGLALADDYEVHAFDWPGFGFSSRPPVDRFTYSPRDYARVLKAMSIAPASTNRRSPFTRRTLAHCRLFCWRWRSPTSPARSSSATSRPSIGRPICGRIYRP